MQVQFGTKTFIKTKFSGLDGKTAVGFSSNESPLELKATSSEVRIGMSGTVEAEDYMALKDFVKTFGEAVDAIYKEHLTLRNAKLKDLHGGSGH